MERLFLLWREDKNSVFLKQIPACDRHLALPLEEPRQLHGLQEGISFGKAKQLRLCHCEEGKSEAPDVAISRYNSSILLYISMDGTRRLPRRFAPRNDIFGAAQRCKKICLSEKKNTRLTCFVSQVKFIQTLLCGKLPPPGDPCCIPFSTGAFFLPVWKPDV